MLFNSEGAIQKYATPEDILRDFYDLRLQFYAKRRAALLRVRRRWEGRAWAGLCRLLRLSAFRAAVLRSHLL